MRLPLILVAAFCAAFCGTAHAVVPPVPSVAAKSFILIDASTNQSLAQQDADAPLPPASLTKIMTSYVAAHEVAAGRVSMNDMVPISVNAWRTGGSKMFIREGTEVLFEDLLRGVIIQSGNDASVAIAEYIAGDEEAFASIMNQHSMNLGMDSSHWVNSTGLPDDAHLSSARDLATLSRALINEFPGHYSIYSERSFKFGEIEQINRNRLLWRDQSVDGVKTGHTQAAGYCLVASALRNGMRLIAVVVGSASDEARVREAQKLLSYGFRHYETQTIKTAGEVLATAPVVYGELDQVDVVVEEAIVVTVPRRAEKTVVDLDIPESLEAPLAAGQQVGVLRVRVGEEVLAEVPAIVVAEVPESGFFAQMVDGIARFFSGLMD